MIFDIIFVSLIVIPFFSAVMLIVYWISKIITTKVDHMMQRQHEKENLLKVARFISEKEQEW